MPQYKQIMEGIEDMLIEAVLEAELHDGPRLSSEQDCVVLDYIVKGANGNLRILQDLKPVIDLVPIDLLQFISTYTGIYPIEDLPKDCGLRGWFTPGLTLVYQSQSTAEADMDVMPDGQIRSRTAELMAKPDYQKAFQLFIDQVRIRR
jgi:hypothetical protein